MALEPIKWKSKIVLVKEEVDYGVDPVPTGGANAMLLTNVTLQPMEGQDVNRNLERAFMGAQEEVPVGLYMVLSGSSELVGSGETGVAPAWSPLMRACGVAEVVTPDDAPGDGTVEYSPVSTGHESVAVHFHIGPNCYVMLGARGSAEISVNALGIPVAAWTITGLFTVPSVQARPTVDLSAFETPQVASKANTPVFTIDAISFAMRNFSLNLGCDVQARMLVGVERIVIVDKAETISTQIEAVPFSTYNPVQRSLSPAPRQPIVLQHGTAAGRRVKIAAARAVQRRFTGGTENQGVEEWPLTFSPLPDAGDDQWKITLT
ncbi:hypothetical protein [Sphingobium cloacae]|uniref:Uncharacterized protein n=1 Tax=Sphingobium cloacae TaxID=120107 RepID=A0A1E1F2M5_9SPHN|nr:hypothetical protein [Sphingobium cloacae]BAV64765.1 hypothetical protein SCLO_1017250 [Sphingobium cloacae]